MTQAYTELGEINRAVATGALGAQHQPGLFYRLLTPVDGPGVFAGVAHSDIPMTRVIWLSTEPITHTDAGTALDGNGGVRFVFRDIRGPAGAVAVEGMLVHTTSVGSTLD